MSSPIDNELAPTENGARLPALGSPELTPEYLARIKEILEVLLGRRGGSNWDRAVTFRDLYQLGISPGDANGFGGPLVLETPGGTVITNSGALGSTPNFDKLLRESSAYKALMTRIGSVDDLAMLPEEFKQQLQHALEDVARARQADIQSLDRKLQNSTKSMASRLVEITAALEETAAGVRSFDGAYADNMRALATSIKMVTASLGNLGSVSVEEKFTAQADVNTGLLGQWTLKAQTNPTNGEPPVFAGIGLSVEDPVAGPGTSALIFMAEKFGFYTNNGTVMPFGIDANGNIYINGTLRINDGGGTLADVTNGLIRNVGEFAAAPAVAGYVAGDVYKNTTDGNTYILRVTNGVKSWALWIAKGTDGAPGAPGADGDDGNDGQRGSLDIAVSGYAGYSGLTTADANTIFQNATGFYRQNRDRMTLYNSSTSETRVFLNTAWVSVAAYINGNMIVNGTLSADVLDGGMITGVEMNINGNFRIYADGTARLYTANLNRCTGVNSDAPGLAAFTATSSGSGPALQANGGSSGNALLIASGANGIVQTGGGGNFMRTIVSATDAAHDLGGPSNRFNNLYVASGTISTSDERTKMDIQAADLGLDFINDLETVKFRQKVAENIVVDNWVEIEPANEFPDDFGNLVQLAPAKFENRPSITPRPGVRFHYGLKAGQVRAALLKHKAGDSAIWVLTDKNDPNSKQALRYDQLITPTIRAVQQVDDKVDAQQDEIDGLKATIAGLQKEMQRLASLIART